MFSEEFIEELEFLVDKYIDSLSIFEDRDAPEYELTQFLDWLKQSV